MPLSMPAGRSCFIDANCLYYCNMLMGDALIVAAMRDQGLADLVTNDDDFDNVAGLRVWKPRP